MRSLTVTAAALAAAMSLLTTQARAVQTIGSLDARANGSSGHAFVGQSFTVPAGETGLTVGSLVLRNVGGADATGVLAVYPYTDGAAAFGAPIASQPFVLPTGSDQVLTRAFNVDVTAGATYALVATWNGPGSLLGSHFDNNYYAGGTTLFESSGAPLAFPGFDQAFQVSFGPVPEPTGMGAAMLAASGMLGRRRRRGG